MEDVLLPAARILGSCRPFSLSSYYFLVFFIIMAWGRIVRDLNRWQAECSTTGTVTPHRLLPISVSISVPYDKLTGHVRRLILVESRPAVCVQGS